MKYNLGDQADVLSVFTKILIGIFQGLSMVELSLQLSAIFGKKQN